MSDLKQAIKKYGQVPCKFSHYYKYEFTFIGKAEDGTKVVITIGGTKRALNQGQGDGG